MAKENINKSKKSVAFITLGCKVNQYETNAMAQKFISSGYKVVRHDEISDIYIVNTCTVTNMSDRKSRQMLRKAKELNKNSILVACGCYAQIAKNELEKIKEIDLVLGNNEKKDIVKYVEQYIKNKNKKIEIQDIMNKKDFVDFGDITYTEKTRAVIKIQDGCDRFCSYCIIPYARGRVRSRKPENIISEIKNIVKTNIKEIVITGIHIASYGKDFTKKYTLIDLLEEINSIKGIERIRLGSIEPLLITEEFINRLKKLKNVCHHFHLSLQSGCNSTLERMNRKYTTEQFRNIVRILRNEYDDVILTTDIIVGFPQESEEEFTQTYNFLKEINFYKMHIFKYSQRRGTKASQMSGQVDGNIKEERSQKLIKLSELNEQQYNKTYIGKEVEVLFEEKKKGVFIGHTKNYILIHYYSKESLDNVIKKVKCKKIEKDYIIAE